MYSIILTLDFNYHNPSGVNHINLVIRWQCISIEAVQSIIPQCVKLLLNIVLQWFAEFIIMRDREIVITNNSLARDEVYPMLILWYAICLMLHLNAASLCLSNQSLTVTILHVKFCLAENEILCSREVLNTCWLRSKYHNDHAVFTSTWMALLPIHCNCSLHFEWNLTNTVNSIFLWLFLNSLTNTYI